jgi:UTP--glucose-1-phosphate uridylyltransferase
MTLTFKYKEKFSFKIEFRTFFPQIEWLNKRYDSDVPLVLMNSFNTDEETLKLVRKYTGFRVRILTFNQSRYPRIHRESLMPIAKDIRTEKNPEA